MNFVLEFDRLKSYKFYFIHNNIEQVLKEFYKNGYLNN